MTIHRVFGPGGATKEEAREWLAAAVARRGGHLLQQPNHPPNCAGTFMTASLSHSGLYAAAAYGIGSLGIDIESLTRPGIELWGRRFLSAVELLEPPLNDVGYIALWTRKEAVLKALGTGLALDPRRLQATGSMPVLDGRPIQRLRVVTTKTDRYVLSLCSRASGPANR